MNEETRGKKKEKEKGEKERKKAGRRKSKRSPCPVGHRDPGKKKKQRGLRPGGVCVRASAATRMCGIDAFWWVCMWP